MTSRHAYKGRKFATAVEIDQAQLQRVNSALLKIPSDFSRIAIRNAFRKWARGTKAAVSAAAPLGPVTPTEWVRGLRRPNPHLKFSVAAKMKTYQRDLVQWVGVGIKEVKGSYLTPHWYLRWVERGHSTFRRIGTPPKKIRGPLGWVKPFDWEARVRKWEQDNRDEIHLAIRTGTRSKGGFARRVSFVPPNPFITRTAARAFHVLEPIVVQEVDAVIRRYGLG